MLDWLACALVRALGALLCSLPPEAAVWVGARCGALAASLQPRRARIGLLNLRAAFDGRMDPREARRIIARCYQQLGAGLFELLRLPVIDHAYLDRYIAFEGLERLHAAAASGRPVVLLTGHYGSWEMSSIAAALLGYPIVVLARAQQKMPRLYRLLVSYRESKGCTVVHKGGAMRRLIAALDHRQMVGIVGDQSSRQGVPIDFFGRAALFATGPFSLAYSKRALIVPAFIHRVRGPFHRIVIEPPCEFSGAQPEAEAIRSGIERFAGVLARHILEDPSQWLWMHKRWKHTASRRVLVLSDGKAGHVKQSLAVVDAVRQRHPAVSSRTVEIRYRHRLARLLTMLWSWAAPSGWGAAACLRLMLTPESADALLKSYADLIVSCGSSTAPVNLLWSADNQAKSVLLMNPAPLPLSRFDLVIAPRHDRLPPRANVIAIDGAMAPAPDADRLAQSAQRLRRHPNFRGSTAPAGPVITLLIGGDTDEFALTEAWTAEMIRQITQACDAAKGTCLATTSRRTPAAVERQLAEGLGADARCRLLLLAGRDAINGTMEGLLGSAAVVVVTGESISMVSEACASGRPVVVVDVPRRRPSARRDTKQARFLRDCVARGEVRVVAAAGLAAAVAEALQARRPPHAPDRAAAVREALSRLL